MQIIPIPAFNDNYIWLLQCGSDAACVDPGDAAPVLDYLKQHNLTLRQIWITHHHNDHTGGIEGLLKAFPDCEVYGNADIQGVTHKIEEGGKVVFCGTEAQVWHVPGHTATHFAYLLLLSDRLHVFCGDTLFSAGCGRVFTGTIGQLFNSIQRFNSLPPDTLFYPAHEYTASDLCFAEYVEPGNTAVKEALRVSDKLPTLPVTLAHERAVNPFLRTDQTILIRQVEKLSGQTLNDDAAVFAALRELKNTF
ncbi:hydroxyacylglutathione hydrolase [Neisseria sp. 83E34]|uniref:hydroxyacylglutathione hydrolase n=1 Tax=Neisseria sp. 83E34 TaxID=1692264 RepID=UPI0006CE8EA2|nr:hydroxyacylglutathione hydrolase [Neisseria sp. 83E34]KPN71021.1 hydroxyacylglutathione hydrolase [Neisseria sp. 83E34]